MAMPPERHAAQPHPWLGGCRAHHPSKPTTQESLLGKLPFNYRLGVFFFLQMARTRWPAAKKKISKNVRPRQPSEKKITN
jgi:hypothetical protein